MLCGKLVDDPSALAFTGVASLLVVVVSGASESEECGSRSGLGGRGVAAGESIGLATESGSAKVVFGGNLS